MVVTILSVWFYPCHIILLVQQRLTCPSMSCPSCPLSYNFTINSVYIVLHRNVFADRADLLDGSFLPIILRCILWKCAFLRTSPFPVYTLVRVQVYSSLCHLNLQSRKPIPIPVARRWSICIEFRPFVPKELDMNLTSLKVGIHRHCSINKLN